MSAAQLHLLVAHLPVFACFAAVILLLAAGIGRNETLFKTACVFLVAAALSSGAAYLSGPAAYASLQTPAGP